MLDDGPSVISVSQTYDVEHERDIGFRMRVLIHIWQLIPAGPAGITRWRLNCQARLVSGVQLGVFKNISIE